MPRPTYRLAMETTRRRLARVRSSRARSPLRLRRSRRWRSTSSSVANVPASSMACDALGGLDAGADPLGQRDLFIRRQQRNLADLLEVDPHRIGRDRRVGRLGDRAPRPTGPALGGCLGFVGLLGFVLGDGRRCLGLVDGDGRLPLGHGGQRVVLVGLVWFDGLVEHDALSGQHGSDAEDDLLGELDALQDSHDLVGGDRSPDAADGQQGVDLLGRDAGERRIGGGLAHAATRSMIQSRRAIVSSDRTSGFIRRDSMCSFNQPVMVA